MFIWACGIFEDSSFAEISVFVPAIPAKVIVGATVTLTHIGAAGKQMMTTNTRFQ